MINLEHTAQVWGIYGNLGGGKTMTAVSMAIEAIKSGFFVCSNVTLNLSPLRRSFPDCDKLYMHIVVRDEQYDDDGNCIKCVDFNPFTIPSGSPRGSNGGKRVLVILDECAEWFDQYQSAKNKSISRVMSWLRHSSKRSQDVVFIVQRREYLNKSFRILVSRWVSVDDLAVWRIPLLKIHVPFMRDYCMAQVFDKVGTPCQNLKFISKSKYGQYYNTAECLSNYGGPAFEYNLPKRKSDYQLYLVIFWILSYFMLLFM